MTKGTDVYPDLEPGKDKVYRIAEAAASLLPTGQVILHSLITPPIQKRTEKWIKETEERLATLENSEQINTSDLLENEVFSAVVLKCIQAVATTSQEEKLAQLSNFVTSLAKTPNLEEDEVHILFGILNEFTPSHVLAVKFYSSPENYAGEISRFTSAAPRASQAQGGELAQVFGGKPEHWQSIFTTALGKSVLSTLTTKVTCSATLERTISGRSTELGDKLLSLISK